MEGRGQQVAGAATHNIGSWRSRCLVSAGAQGEMCVSYAQSGDGWAIRKLVQDMLQTRAPEERCQHG